MSWQECDTVSLRRELVELAVSQAAGVAELSRRFGVSRKTVYKWLARYRGGGVEALEDRPRRPKTFRNRTAVELEQAVLTVRRKHPAWGGRKIEARLKLDGQADVPRPSTITGILHRHELIDPRESAKRRELSRFERPWPNDLWQMDFKGEFKMGNGLWCHPLTVLDDHSRYSLALRACSDHQSLTVRGQLIETFRRYGLPRQMLMDHGVPWCTAHSVGGWTQLSVWLLRLDIGVTHGRICHPQTQGKDERFHRTFKVELKPGPWIRDVEEAQRQFDPWRESYNYERPHEALQMQPPSSRYRLSGRPYPEQLPAIEYGPQDQVRTVNPVGQFSFQSRRCKTSEAFKAERIALRPTVWDGVWDVYYSRQRIGTLDLRGSRPGGPTVPVANRRPEDLVPPDKDAASTRPAEPPDAEAVPGRPAATRAAVENEAEPL